MALFRAIETHRKDGLFADALALGFLEPKLRLAGSLTRVAPLRNAICWFIDRRWPGARLSGVARTRRIDDVLSESLREGIEQLAILGAGYDSRPYRLAGLESIRVFEIDHPATSASKQERLGGIPRSHVTYVGVDFDKDELGEALEKAGVDLSRRTFFLWEGVTNYLTADAVDRTLHHISSASAGSLLLFTYVHRRALEHPEEFEGMKTLRKTLEQAGEPWTFGLDPDELGAWLNARGFELIEDAGTQDLRKKYLGESRPRGYGFYRLAVARVLPSARAI